MNTADTLARMIRERERDIAELQAELDVLRAGLPQAVRWVPPAPAPAGNGAASPAKRAIGKHTRLDMLRRLLVKAGRAGLTRHEAIEQMAAICDSPANSVCQMLTILGKHRLARPNPNGHWTAIR